MRLVTKLLISSGTLLSGVLSAQTPSIELEIVATGLNLPVGVENAGDGSDRLFVLEQAGVIRIVDHGQLLPTPFLNISGLVVTDNEKGLLGLAFDPDYASTGEFYVRYSAPGGVGSQHTARLARYTVSAGDPNVANPSSAEVVLEQTEPERNHNAGQVRFGPDGMLYVALGDGGALLGHGQNTNTLLGSLLRLDVRGQTTYAIPAGNPFGPGGSPGADEIWVYGLRNPWRFSFDRLTGDLFIADVGHDRREEVNFLAGGGVGGENLGWESLEGTLCFDPPGGCDTSNKVAPILEYAHGTIEDRCAVIGGFRYRGASAPLYGRYVFADHCTSEIFVATESSGQWSFETAVNGGFGRVTSFGESEAGELYMTTLDNRLYALTVPIFTDGFESGNVSSWSSSIP